MFEFKLLKTDPDSKARLGQAILPPLGEKHAPKSMPENLVKAARLVETPGFMPVGTLATVKALLPETVAAAGAQMILCNTYHLMLRPGETVIEQLGGLHRFMNWPGGIITDSGGFQVYSLAKLRTIDDAGVTFQHHLDGSMVRLDPARALEVQRALGSDIAMVLDECLPWPAAKTDMETGVARTVTWAKRSREVMRQWSAEDGRRSPAVFAISQGGLDFELRQRCTEALVDLDFPGYALGGFSVGEPMSETYELVGRLAPFLPAGKPRYLMGVGTPADLINLVAQGVDLFDCVLPSRNARNGQVFTSVGKVVLSHASLTRDDSPLDANCQCDVCRNYSRAYLRHIYQAKEILASVLATTHNHFFYQDVMRRARAAIANGTFSAFRRDFLELQKQTQSA